ncbi:MAG: MBL fold metallo-hydrolase [Myxococcota bacterium]|jgi:glyoxylase-like metal-dependent hydrolase (beta-lactamase superfamily II)
MAIRTFELPLALALAVCPCQSTAEPAAPPIAVTVYKGGFATVNSYILSNGKSLTVIDTQRKDYEARKLVDLVRSLHLPLTQVLITHGHTDHFTGMHVFRDQFPRAKILVANESIRRDVKAYAIYMDRGGATEAESPLERPLRPKSREFPGGFDYERTIGLLPTSKLELTGGGNCEVNTGYPATEAPFMATLYCPSINALFLADLGYNKMHPWMGDDITIARVTAWRGELVKIRRNYASLNPTIYPGHGDPGDLAMLDEQIRYFDDYLRIVATAGSRADAAARITALYPDYKEAEFFLKYSLLNHIP